MLADSDTDADTDTDTDTDWVTVPTGSFWIGSPDGTCPSDYPGGSGCVSELGHITDETLHYVTLTHPFEIHVHEVTQGEWFTAFAQCLFPHHRNGRRPSPDRHSAKRDGG